MKKLLLLLLAFSFTTFLFLFPYPYILYPTFAQSTDELSQQLKDKQAEIAKLESQLVNTQKQEKTLKSQLALIDGQTKVTELKIEETTLKIEKLKREINDLNTRITRIGATLDTLSEILLHRIVQTYKYNNTVSTLNLLFSSHGFAQVLDRLKYIQVAQTYDKKKLYELQATKLAYNDQKQDKQTRQIEAEKLNKELGNYKTQLSQQKKDKEELLRITKNDEAHFQSLIAQLRAEVSSIAQAISNIGPVIGPVAKGQTIAAMGSTGCSTGPHLHFEVFENARVENGRIIGNRVNPHDYLDKGRLGSPLSGFPGGDWAITTEYNESYDVFGYSSKHTGLDIAPTGGGGLGKSVQVTEKGIAYSTSATCDCYVKKTCTPTMMNGGSAIGKGVVVDHENGIVTLYWHIL